jgi:hypothetical protein
MKNPYEVLRCKEQELSRIRKEVEALRIAARLLGEEQPGSDTQEELRKVAEMP